MRPRLETLIERKSQECRCTLAVRRQLADLDPAILAAEWLHPLGPVRKQIILSEPGGRRDRRCDLTYIERIRPLLRDPPERECEVGEPVALPGSRRRQRRQRSASPLVSDSRSTHRPFPRQVGRRPDCDIEPEPAEA